MADYQGLVASTFSPTAVSTYNADTGAIGSLTADITGATFVCTAAVPLGWYKRYVYWQYTVPAEIVAAAQYAYISLVVDPSSLLNPGSYWEWQLCPLTPPQDVQVRSYTGLNIGLNSYTLFPSEIPNLADPTYAFGLMAWSQHADSSNPLNLSVAAPIITIYHTPIEPITHTLTVESSNPDSGVDVSVTPNDNDGNGNGSTSFTRTYNAGTDVTLVAPDAVGNHVFSAWSGADTVNGRTASITLNADSVVTASYITASSQGSEKETPQDAVLIIPSFNAGDTRAQKRFGDLYIEAGKKGS